MGNGLADARRQRRDEMRSQHKWIDRQGFIEHVADDIERVYIRSEKSLDNPVKINLEDWILNTADKRWIENIDGMSDRSFNQLVKDVRKDVYGKRMNHLVLVDG